MLYLIVAVRFDNSIGTVKASVYTQNFYQRVGFQTYSPTSEHDFDIDYQVSLKKLTRQKLHTSKKSKFVRSERNLYTLHSG